MNKPVKKIYHWAAKKAHSNYSPLWLGVIFLLEMALFIPLDAILMLFCLENPRKKYLYVTIATLISAFSGLVGYCLGLMLWDAIGPYVLAHLISPGFFNHLAQHYQFHQNWAVFVGSFLPIPFKAISLSAGACQISLIPFILFVFLARACRFLIIAELIRLWGSKIKDFIDRHFNRIIIAVGAKLALTFTFFWALGH